MKIVKLDSLGEIEWREPLGKDYLGTGNEIIETPDGGYILAGDSTNFISEYDYSSYSKVIKFDQSGNRIWDVSGEQFSHAKSIKVTADSGYIVVGNVLVDNTPDIYLMKLDKDGNKLWEKTFGGSGYDYSSSIVLSSNGYIIAGQTESEGNGKYDMWILKLDENGNSTTTGNIWGTELPEEFSLGQNYPNPFNPETTIEFQIMKLGYVKLTVYSALAQKVKELINNELNVGLHSVKFNGGGFASGIYFYKLETDQFTKTKKMMLIK